jgi:Isoprenylcysteine carboxyl methyltransferase (ICMT) family
MSRSPSRAAAIPVSDVSAAVGISGMVGLGLWVMFARNWPTIAPMLGVEGHQEPLSGPYGALMCVLVAGIPMIAWSIFVDKVHLRPSTGIDWSLRRNVRDIIDISITKLAGLWSTWALIGLVYCTQRFYWRDTWLFAMDVIGWITIPMFVLSVPYVIWLDRHLVNPRDGSWHFGAMLIGREPYDLDEVWHHLRAWAVKGFFCAFMISILPFGFESVVLTNYSAVFGNPVATSNALVNHMFLFDVHIAMVGYLVTMKPLDAHIRSANPYLAGWVSALACYPPFIMMGGNGVLDYHPGTGDWGMFLEGHTFWLWVWGTALVFLTGIYAWATVIFGIRFSNLTYRGIITNGPYRFTRHPAYLSKNAFWWLATLPFISVTGSVTDSIRNTLLLAGVSAVYWWRAKTEEKHLLGEDAKYREYHAWMAENAPITRGLAKLTSVLKPRGPRLQPAE